MNTFPARPAGWMPVSGKKIKRKCITNVNHNSLMDKFFSNISLLQIILKWKWHLAVLAVAAALVSLVVSSSWIMKPRFKSVAIIYPSNIAPYSEESQTEQMLQWLNSSDVRSEVMKKFDLPRHYGVSPNEKYYATILEGYYNKNVKISKTQYESIEVSVTDIDPVMARDMVNAILFFTDQKIGHVHHSKYQEVIEALQTTLKSKKSEIDSVKALYRDIAMKYGVYDIGGQSQEITRGELRTVAGGGGNINTKDVTRLKDGMMEKSAELIFLNNRLWNLGNEYGELMRRYDLALLDVTKKITFINSVTPPLVADKKSYPKRLFVMFYFVAGTLLCSLLAIVILEQRKNDSSEINNG
jgi:capsule polysaccharide export protein KpsE/RkpR